MEKTKKYVPNGGAITEMICSGLAVLLIFISWLTLNAPDHSIIDNAPSEYERMQNSGGPGAYIFIGICFVNIILKFFSRSSWLSAICAIFFGALVFQSIQAMQEINTSEYYRIPGAGLSLSVGGFCAIIVELIFAVSTIVGIFQWLANSTRKTAKRLFVAALFGLVLCGIAFYLMMKGANSEEDMVLVFFSIFSTIGILMFVLCGLFGIIIWVRNKKEKSDIEQTYIEENDRKISETQSEKASFVLSDIDKEKVAPIIKEKDSSSKKWLYIIGGGILAAILVGLGLWFAFSGSSGNNPLSVEKPAWKKFIVVTSQNVPLHKDASSGSPQLMEALENSESCMADREFRWEDQGKKRGYTLCPYNLEKNVVLPVLDETDTWYKVQVDDAMIGVIEAAYIQKEWTREIQPEPITEEVLARMGKTMQRCDHVVKSGKLKNLCLTTRFHETDGEFFEVGVLIDGALIYPQHKGVFLKQDGPSGVDFQKNVDYDNYTLIYGEDCQMNIDEYSKIFDPRKLTDEKIKQIFESVNQVNPSAPIEVEYYFPEANHDSFFRFSYTPGQGNANISSVDSDAEDTKVTGYRVSGHELLAELGEAYERTNIMENCDIEIADIGDYDGNGDMEAIIYKKDGENDELTEPPFMVFYDHISKEYKRTDPFLLTFWVSKEDWEGKTSLIQAKGLHKVRYMFDGKGLKQVQNTIEGVGNALKKWTCKELYPDGGMDERIVKFDIDRDGNMESIVFGHNDSRACGYGRDMFIVKIQWESGRTIGDEYFGLQSASTFSILESMTNGMHDILLDESWYFRWNGSLYEQWTWDGSMFVKMGG